MRRKLRRPARNAMMLGTGYSYDRFVNYESLGYRLVDVVKPRLPWLLDIPWMPWYRVPKELGVLVYCREAGR